MLRKPIEAGPVERQPPDPLSPWLSVHLARYRFALGYVKDGRILDIACGTGYGAAELSTHARAVIGVDVDVNAAAIAHSQFSSVSGGVVVADGRKLPFENGRFDVVVSFETLEHLSERHAFLTELARVLTDDGILILSTPNANHTLPVDGKPRNPFHVHEYTPGELGTELLRFFSSVTILGQVLDTRFRVPPFWDEQERLSEKGKRGRVLVWRALSKMPRRLADRVSGVLWKHPLFPGAEDYRFQEGCVESAPVLIALCHQDETLLERC